MLGGRSRTKPRGPMRTRTAKDSTIPGVPLLDVVGPRSGWPFVLRLAAQLRTQDAAACRSATGGLFDQVRPAPMPGPNVGRSPAALKVGPLGARRPAIWFDEKAGVGRSSRLRLAPRDAPRSARVQVVVARSARVLGWSRRGMFPRTAASSFLTASVERRIPYHYIIYQYYYPKHGI